MERIIPIEGPTSAECVGEDGRFWPDELAVKGKPYGLEAGNSILHNVIIDFDRREIRFPFAVSLGPGEIIGAGAGIRRDPQYPYTPREIEPTPCQCP